jgi:uncharacterized membrane protein
LCIHSKPARKEETMMEQTSAQGAGQGMATAGHIPPTAYRDTAPNVEGTERVGSAILGALCLLWGTRRQGFAGALGIIGGLGLIGRAATGRCAMKRALQPSPYEQRIAEANHWPRANVRTAAVTIARPRHEVYQLWRDFGNLPRFMSHVESIEVITPQRSRWTVKAPLDKTVTWISHVTEDVENARIAWEAEGGAEIPNFGWVEFRDAPGGRGTEVQAMIAYQPPYGRAGHVVDALFGETPGHQMRDDLRRLKQFLETGEVATSQIQRQN